MTLELAFVIAALSILTGTYHAINKRDHMFILFCWAVSTLAVCVIISEVAA